MLTCRLLVVVAQMISDLGLLSGSRLLIVLEVLADGVGMCRRMLGKGEVCDFDAPILVEQSLEWGGAIRPWNSTSLHIIQKSR